MINEGTVNMTAQRNLKVYLFYLTLFILATILYMFGSVKLNLHELKYIRYFGSTQPPLDTCPEGIRSTPKNWSYRAPGAKHKALCYDKTNDDYCYCPFKSRIQTPPAPFIAESKSPCYRDPTDGQLRCFPYFYIAGYTKCATTDSYDRISRHPDFLGSKKELHWFDFWQFVRDKSNLSFYAGYNEDLAKKVETDLKTSGSSRAITGDASPCTIWFSLHWRCIEGNEGLEEPRITNADLVYKINPKAKFIVLVREPVNRLYSRYLFTIDKGLDHPAYLMSMSASPAAFHDLVTNAVAKYEDCFKRWSHRHCLYNGTLHTEVSLRLQEGMYSVSIRDWLRVFPADQLLILRFEDYVQDKNEAFTKIFQFLDLGTLDEKSMQGLLNSGVSNKGPHKDLGEMFPETRKILEDFYKPFVLELADMMGNDSFLWHYSRNKV